ncbi:hypothetical protein JO41_03755 [Treponema sp. OMZ 838]|nr:hypothetical protein JO41_03755 [Treponema sp. OMZ 838]
MISVNDLYSIFKPLHLAYSWSGFFMQSIVSVQARGRTRFKQTVVQITDNTVCFQKDKSQL